MKAVFAVEGRFYCIHQFYVYLQLVVGEGRSPEISVHNQVQSKILTQSRQIRCFGKYSTSAIQTCQNIHKLSVIFCKAVLY